MSSFPITAEQLANLPSEFRTLVRAIIDHYEARIAKLESQIDELEGRTGKTPQNSSLPPPARSILTPSRPPPSPNPRNSVAASGVIPSTSVPCSQPSNETTCNR